MSNGLVERNNAFVKGTGHLKKKTLVEILKCFYLNPLPQLLMCLVADFSECFIFLQSGLRKKLIFRKGFILNLWFTLNIG